MARKSTWWHEKAACRNFELDDFFPHETDTIGLDEAKQVCWRCPVREACLDYALTTGQRYGVWGGLTGRERDNRRRVLNRQAAKVQAPPKAAEKVCGRCRERLPADDFPRDGRSKDGLNSWCKRCANEAERQRRVERRVAS